MIRVGGPSMVNVWQSRPDAAHSNPHVSITNCDGVPDGYKSSHVGQKNSVRSSRSVGAARFHSLCGPTATQAILAPTAH